MNTYNNTYRKVGRTLAAVALLMVQTLCFVACTDDLRDADALPADYRLTRGYTNEQIKLQRLGYAYNAAGNVMDDNSFSAAPILNIERLQAAEKKYGLIINSERRHYTSMDIFSGNTLQEVGQAESKYTIDDSEAISSGKFYRNSTTFSKTTWHSTYKAHVFMKHVMATMTIDTGLLHCLKLDSLENADNVLEADFRKEVIALVKKGEGGITEQDATAFSEKYGTHLVVSSNLGGMIELQMLIKRDSCVNKEYTTLQVTEIILGKQVVKTSPSKIISEKIPVNTVEYEGQINVKGGSPTICQNLHKTFDQKKAAEVKISDGDYYNWATSISIEPNEKYNASFVSGRYLALYQLFEDYNTRQVLRQVYKLYMKKEAPLPEPYEPPYGVLPVEGNYGPDVRVVSAGADKACILCQEYVPSIRSDKPCIVAYPLLKDTLGNFRPHLFSGLFVGDESHRPGYVVWKGSASFYTPSDSIFYESDSTAVHNLFDENTHALKNVYFYWNAVHPQPCPTKEEAPKAYTASVFTAQPRMLAKAMTFAKVASTFWSVQPVELKTDSLKKYWDGDSQFRDFKQYRNKENDGVLLKDTIENKYFFALLDGGDNIKRVGTVVDDPGANKQWTNAVSQSMKALGLVENGHSYLPSVEAAKSITKMLGNRMGIFYSHEYGGRNMLGLDWPTGYWILSHPSRGNDAANPQREDGQGMPIVTDDVGQARILRLSRSGTDLMLEYPEYVRSFNYSDQAYFKFFPIYITIDKF